MSTAGEGRPQEPARRAEPLKRRLGQRLRGRASDWAAKALALVVLLVFWQALAAIYPFLPAPVVAFDRVGQLVVTGLFFTHAVPTVLRVLAGFILALVAGSAVGILMGAKKPLESFFELYILVGLTVPGLAWAVLALMFFGITEVAPVFAIFVVVTPMLAVNMWQGTKAIDRDLLEMAQAFRIARHRVVRDIVLPQLLPYLLAGSRFGFALGWKVVVLSEMFGLSSGIGYMINRSFSNYSMLNVVAWTMSFTLLMGLFEYAILRPVERHLVRWRPVVAL